MKQHVLTISSELLDDFGWVCAKGKRTFFIKRTIFRRNDGAVADCRNTMIGLKLEGYTRPRVKRCIKAVYRFSTNNAPFVTMRKIYYERSFYFLYDTLAIFTDGHNRLSRGGF